MSEENKALLADAVASVFPNCPSTVSMPDGIEICVVNIPDDDGEIAELIAAALRQAYSPKPERPASDIDLRAFLDVCFGWYGEDDSAVPISPQVMSFFNGRHGLKIPNAGTVTTPYKNQVTGDMVPARIYEDWLPAARRLADDFESLAAQIREILENSE